MAENPNSREEQAIGIVVKVDENNKPSCDLVALGKVLTRDYGRQVIVNCAEIEAASTKGTNFTSDVWRVHYTYGIEGSADQQMDSVVVKTAPTCDETRDLMNTQTAFINEIYAYEHVIPTLSIELRALLRVPKFLHANDTCVVLEDMSTKKFEPMNKKLAVEWTPLWSTIQEMAKLHAASIIMKRTSPSKFDALVNSIVRVPIEKTALLGEKQDRSVDTILKVLEQSKNPEAPKYTEMVKVLRDNVWIKQKAIIDAEAPVRVINHGSIWINSVLYRNDMITLLDWQHIVYSSPAQDLSFFLWVNLDTDFLASNREKLLEYYIVNLHQYVYDGCINIIETSELNELLEPLTVDWIKSEMKRFSMYGYMMAQWTTPVFYWSEAVFETFVNRGGLESMPVEERMKHLTSDQRDRIIKLTKLYAEYSK